MSSLFTASLVSASSGEFDLGPEVAYYEVSGETAEELDASLLANAVGGPYGGSAAGLTKWLVTWSYSPWKRASGCELVHISVSLDTSVTLPRWKRGEEPPEDLVDWWAIFVRAVERHELGHMENARAARRGVEEALASVAPGVTCGATMRRAEKAATAVVLEHRALDRRYDRDTRYGRDDLEAAFAGRAE